MKNYANLNDKQKKDLIQKHYVQEMLSFAVIAAKYNTYANKVRRDAVKYNIDIRDKSQAQKTALDKGRHTHPTKGKKRSEKEKQNIGLGVMKAWENIDAEELKRRQDKARSNWNKLSPQEQKNILQKANSAVRLSSSIGSKMELYLLEQLIADGYRVDFHKEQTLVNTKLQIDLFLPTMGIAIEVDGPSHFEPVWGEDALEKNQKYDNKKNGIILGKGLALIRIKQSKDFSKTRANVIYQELKHKIETIKTSKDKYIEIGE